MPLSERHIGNIRSFVQVLYTEVGGSHSTEFEFQSFPYSDSSEVGQRGGLLDTRVSSDIIVKTFLL